MSFYVAKLMLGCGLIMLMQPFSVSMSVRTAAEHAYARTLLVSVLFAAQRRLLPDACSAGASPCASLYAAKLMLGRG